MKRRSKHVYFIAFILMVLGVLLQGLLLSSTLYILGGERRHKAPFGVRSKLTKSSSYQGGSSCPIIPILAHFRPLFTAPTWKKVMLLLAGTILARGRRTVTTALYQTGHQFDTNFSAFHQVLNRARWSPLQVSRHLLFRIMESFIQAGGGIDRVID